jgi:hypothetical protein
VSVEKSQAFLPLKPSQQTRFAWIALQSACVSQPGLQALGGLDPDVSMMHTLARPVEL